MATDPADEPPDILQTIQKKFRLSAEQLSNIKKVIAVYPMAISDYYLSLIKEPGDPIWKQCVPDIKELCDQTGEEDP